MSHDLRVHLIAQQELLVQRGERQSDERSKLSSAQIRHLVFLVESEVNLRHVDETSVLIRCLGLNLVVDEVLEGLTDKVQFCFDPDVVECLSLLHRQAFAHLPLRQPAEPLKFFDEVQSLVFKICRWEKLVVVHF